jgi:hypothetical protein
MTLAAAVAVTGPLGQQPGTGQATYALKAPWSQMVTEYDTVRRIQTKTPACRTSRGLGVGSTIGAVRQVYAGASVSVLAHGANGDLLSYPFLGVAFQLRLETVEAVEVFRPEAGAARPAPAPTPGGTRQTPPGTPGPAPGISPGAWGIRSASARVDGTTLIVAGSVENRSRPAAAYAEVLAFSAAGKKVGEANAPLYPNPVLLGGVATFEVRVAIEDVVSRYRVMIRPLGQPQTTLAEHTGEIRDFTQFGAVVARQLDVTVKAIRNPATPRDFVLVVTNPTALRLDLVDVYVEVDAICAARHEIWRGTISVERIGPGSTAQAPMVMEQSVCEAFGAWATRTIRVEDVRIGT